MVNYAESKIYKIVCNVTGLVYIGSTCEPTLAKRLTKHVGTYRCYLNNKYHYVTSFKVIENSDYYIELIEKYPCNDKDELLQRERHWSNQIYCVNKYKAGLYNQLGVKEYNKQYRETNKVTLKKNQTVKHVCACGGRYSQSNKSTHAKSIKHIEYEEYKEENDE
jgi:hypothetical protein